MTVITFYEENSKILGFSIIGHTNFRQYGEDIVCASISSTSLMTVNALLEVLKIDKLNYKIKDGYLSVDLRNLREQQNDKTTQNFLISLKLFLQDLAKEYPKQIKFEIGRYEL